MYLDLAGMGRKKRPGDAAIPVMIPLSVCNFRAKVYRKGGIITGITASPEGWYST
jgi:hypothetical protein